MEHCCHNMKHFSTPTEERLANLAALLDRIGEDGSDLPDVADPIVEFAAHLGIYTIDNVAIFFCPWCGAQAPRISEEAWARFKGP